MVSIDTGVALTGFSGLESPGPGVSVARALREGWGGDLILTALGGDPVLAGAWLPGLIDRIHRLPPTAGGEDAFFKAVLRAHGESPFGALIPGSGADARVVARLKERLHKRGIRTLLPSLERLEIVRPENLPRFLGGHRFSGPPSVAVTDPADAARQADQLGYPLYVTCTSSESRLVFNAAQAELAVARAAADNGARIVLRRQVAGEKFNIAMVADRQGGCAAMVIRRSLVVNGEGRTVSGAVVEDPDVASFARDVLEVLDWQGPLELVAVRAAGSKDLWLCDLRGHLPTWSMLCHWAGTNLAVLLLGHILEIHDRTGTQTLARAGTMYVRGIAETAIPIEDLRDYRRRRGVKGRPATNGASRPARNGAAPHGLKVALTGISSFDVINPGLGVARALRTADGISQVYGLAYGTFDSGAYQGALFDRCFNLPHGESGDSLLERLVEIHDASPFDVLIPCLDGELPLFIELANKLREIGVHTLLPSGESLERRSKPNLFRGTLPSDWGGFAIPDSRIAKSEAQVLKAVRSLGLPAVVKGPVSHCIPIASEADAKSAWAQLSASSPQEVIVQSHIVGPVYAVSVVCDADHRVVSTLTIKKLAICERGSTWSAVRVEQPRLEAAFAEFLRSIEWVGPAEGEFMCDEVTDCFYLIEVNPRFTAWIYYSAALGSNQPYLAAQLAMGKHANPAADDKALVFLRSSEEIPLRASHIAALSTKGVLSHD